MIYLVNLVYKICLVNLYNYTPLNSAFRFWPLLNRSVDKEYCCFGEIHMKFLSASLIQHGIAVREKNNIWSTGSMALSDNGVFKIYKTLIEFQSLTLSAWYPCKSHENANDSGCNSRDTTTCNCNHLAYQLMQQIDGNSLLTINYIIHKIVIHWLQNRPVFDKKHH